MENLLASLPDFIAQIDLEARLLWANQPVQLEDGSSLIGCRVTDWPAQDWRAVPWAAVHQAAQSGQGVELEQEGCSFEGLPFVTRFRLQPLPAGQGVVVVGEDVSAARLTERQEEAHCAELARQRQHQRTQLEYLQKELEGLHYSISHDLQSPLRAINGFTQALGEVSAQNLGPDGQHYLERISAANQQLGKYFEGMLSLSRLTRGEMLLQELDLSALAESLLDDLQAQQPHRPARCRIQPGLTVRGDVSLTRVLLENLLSNAWKFSSQQAQAEIALGEAAPSDEGQRVFFVRDNGIGFDPQRAERLFLPFQRLHASPDFPGLGIGLAVAQRVVNRHGGRIWAESQLGQGATFFFSLGGL